MSFLDIALRNAARGFLVHPLVPGDKGPITPHGWHDATADEAQIRQWWSKTPNANVGLACGPSGKAVLDVDNGLADEAAFYKWREASGLPETYTVRTGRRPGFGVQMYFNGPVPDVGMFTLNGCTGQIKSAGGYVLAAGCLHPSGETYQVLCDAATADTPDVVRNLRTVKREAPTAGGPISKIPEGGGRHHALASAAGKLRNLGLDEDALVQALIPINEAICEVPVDIGDLEHIAHSMAQKPVPAPEPTLKPLSPAVEAKRQTIQLFHSREEAEHAPDISFAIDGFLQNEGITGLSAPPGQRKTIILLNVVRSLLTGDALFGKFKVLERAARIIYLTPEVSLSPFVSRLRQFELMDYIGDRFSFRTLSAQGKLPLHAPELLDAVQGAHVILDTVPRFVEGDENNAEDIRQLGENLFALLHSKARSVIGAFHMPKGAKRNDYFDLETCVRGSGDLGALLSACWGTRLQDEKDVYHCASYMECVKQRDFEACAPFELMPSKSGILTAREGVYVASLAPGLGHHSVTNKDGQQPAALEFIRQHPEMTLRQVADGLAAMGIKRGKDWISKQRKAVLSTAADKGGVLGVCSPNQQT
jgi:Bifunctional DNA primase/polymerase, N-terminal/AAA domain/Primase C terminal 1 (PriCT-1)